MRPIRAFVWKDVEVAKYIKLYLWIIPISYGLRGCAYLTVSVLNAINKPILGIGLNLVWMVMLYIPLAVIGSRIAGLAGLFVGLCLANLLAGILAIILNWHVPKPVSGS